MSESGDLLERFLRYVRVPTTADPAATRKPSSEGQWVLLQMLQQEFAAWSAFETTLLPEGYLLARKAGTLPDAPPLVLLAHVDTSPDAPGEGVNPQVHPNYRGQVIELAGGVRLDPAVDDYLANCVGDTVITSDGTTLLGADDKAGVAVLVSYAAWLQDHPEAPHPDLMIVFTTDEEIGRGVEDFPFERIRARRGLTIDGGRLGELEDECYEAYRVEVECQGRSHHPGDARGRLVNAVTMAATLVSLLPRNESPEATDGRYGCLWAHHIHGTIESAGVSVLVRDFDDTVCQRRIELVRQAARTVELSFPGGEVRVRTSKQYSNMKRFLNQDPAYVDLVLRAVASAGVVPLRRSIRGGTDGARLSEAGLLCPNLFAGGANFHSRSEWVPLGAMQAALRVLQRLGALLGGERV